MSNITWVCGKSALIGLTTLAVVLLGVGSEEAIYDKELEVKGESIEQQEQEIENQQKEKLRRRLFSYCADTANPQVCEELAEAGIKIQDRWGIKGLPEFTLAVANNESRFLPQYCPAKNCLGLGASSPQRHMSFDSYSASVDYLAQLLLNRYGKRPITPSGVWEIASWYAGSPSWAKRILWFMERL